MQPGQFVLRLGWLGTYVQTQHDDTADVVGQGSIPIIHDQDLAITEARLSLDAGLTKRFAASLVVPVRVVSTSIIYRNGMDVPVQLAQPSTHHRNETLSGIADPIALGAFSTTLAGTSFTLRAGTSIPLGRTEDDPFALGDAGMQHQHIQMGTGTFNPVLALEASRGWDAWRFGGFAYTQQAVYENSKGYHAGDRYAVGLSLRRLLGNVWSVRGGSEFQAESAERWNGVKHTDEGNQGRIDVLLAAGVAWTPTPSVTFDFTLKVPVYTHVVGGQLDVPAIAELGASWSFGGGAKGEEEEDHDHEHAHGDEHDHDHGDEHAGKHGEHGDDDKHHEAALDTTGADVADVGSGGQRVDLTPVAGKLTIFDFWAEWCAPCKELEPALVDIARANPNVAIRRVEVPDWDSPVAAQHLTRGGYSLPHLKAYDEKGNIVLEQSSAPGKLGALIDAVRALAAARAPKPTPAEPTQTTQATPAEPTQTTQAPMQSTPQPAPAQKPAVMKPLIIEIAVTAKGFVPGDVKVPRKRPVVLRFRRSFAKTCATEVVLDHEGKRIIKDLPLDKTIDLALTFTRPGTVKYGCAMDMMIGGTITVQ
jgi:thiol-disulfide isomerase/thioredoxin